MDGLSDVFNQDGMEILMIECLYLDFKKEGRVTPYAAEPPLHEAILYFLVYQNSRNLLTSLTYE